MRRLFFLAGILLLAACGRVDLEAERAALRGADQAWAQTPPDLERFMEFFADDATAIFPDAEPAKGKPAIRNLWSGMFHAPEFSLKWTHTSAEVSPDARLGYTTGTFEFTLQDSGGTTHRRTGKYLTVWKKQPDGQWRVAADIAALDSPPTGK